jgi:DNA-binding transcriptional LysR family regulator
MSRTGYEKQAKVASMQKRQLFTDRLLAQMPSLRALRCFVTAARYESFTQAAEVLCVTQAAISKQIKELEDSLDVALFQRTGRHIALTDAGRILYNASYLSIMNIAEAAEAVRRTEKHALTLCVSHTFSALWLSPRLAAFRRLHPGIRLHVTVTDQFMELDELMEPDVIITKNPPRAGIRSGAAVPRCGLPGVQPGILRAAFSRQENQAAGLAGPSFATPVTAGPYPGMRARGLAGMAQLVPEGGRFGPGQRRQLSGKQ